jgi:hypothetical protein
MPYFEPYTYSTGRTGSVCRFSRASQLMMDARSPEVVPQEITAVFDAVSPHPAWILQFASGEPGESWFGSLRRTPTRRGHSRTRRSDG